MSCLLVQMFLSLIVVVINRLFSILLYLSHVQIAQAPWKGIVDVYTPAVPIPESNLLCSECSFLLKDAVQTCDGIRMCQHCFDEIKG